MIAIPSPLFPNTGLRRLRVGIVTETYGPEVNGVAMTVGRLVEGLLARGHSVQLIRPRQHPRDDPHRDGPLDVWPVAGAAIPFYRDLRIGFPAGRLLLERWRQAPPDVVHIVTEGPLGHSALAVARRLRLRVFSGFHTNFHAYSRHYGMGLLARSIVAYLRRFHNRTDCTLVPTEELATELRTLGFHRLRVLARGVAFAKPFQGFVQFAQAQVDVTELALTLGQIHLKHLVFRLVIGQEQSGFVALFVFGLCLDEIALICVQAAKLVVCETGVAAGCVCWRKWRKAFRRDRRHPSPKWWRRPCGSRSMDSPYSCMATPASRWKRSARSMVMRVRHRSMTRKRNSQPRVILTVERGPFLAGQTRSSVRL